MIMAVLALSLRPGLGLWRHSLLRPGRVLRARRLHLRDRDDQPRREHAAASSWRSLVPAAFAALLGYFMFYGRISDVYLGVITLTVTLILFNSVNSTAGPEFHIGAARLGGFNGIPGIPPLNVPASSRTGSSISKACSISSIGLAAGDLFRAARAAGEPLRPGHGRHPRERAAGASCSATIPAPTSSRPSRSAAALAGSRAACSPTGAPSSARRSSASRNRRRSSSG